MLADLLDKTSVPDATGTSVEESAAERPPVGETYLACGVPSLEGVYCGKPAVAKWTIALFGQLLVVDLHTCADHDAMVVSPTGLVFKRDQLKRVVSAGGGGIILPGQV